MFGARYLARAIGQLRPPMPVNDTITDVWHGQATPRLTRRGRWAGQRAPPSVKRRSSAWTSSSTQAEGADEEDAVAVAVGQVSLNLERCWRAYRRRVDGEHTSSWPRPPPGGSRRRSANLSSGPLDLACCRHLHPAPAASGRVVDLRPPGERPAIPNNSPHARAASFRRLRAAIGTPAIPPKHSQAEPGRPKGTRRPPRTVIDRSRERHEVVSAQRQAQRSCRAW